MSDSGNPLVEAVKKHALENYEASFGWSEVIECWDDADIARVVDGCTDGPDAIRAMGEMVSIRDERYREAIGPDVECPECGTHFGENTACPKCR